MSTTTVAPQTGSSEIVISAASRASKQEFDWGHLTWYAGAYLYNSDDMTVGKCVIRPGQSNPLHQHPNCSEILVVLKGTISHTAANDTRQKMNEGDTVTVPAGILHNAENIGTNNAELLVVFSSANRITKGE